MVINANDKSKGCSSKFVCPRIPRARGLFSGPNIWAHSAKRARENIGWAHSFTPRFLPHESKKTVLKP